MIVLTHHDIQNTEKFSMSGPVKFDEKQQIDKPAGNHPYYFLERSDHVKPDIRLVAWISSLLDGQFSHTVIFQKLKNSACPYL